MARRLEHLREEARQIAEHPDRLRTLPGEQHGQFAWGRTRGRSVRRPVCATTMRPARPRAAADAFGDELRQIREVAVRGEHEPASASGHRTTAATAPRIGRRRSSPLGSARSFAASCLRRFRAERDDFHRTVPVHLGLLGSVFLEDRVEVAAAEAERRQGGPARVVGTRQPGPHLRVHVERRIRRRERLDRLRHLDASAAAPCGAARAPP